MPINLAPQTGRGGVIIWDRHAIALHIFWLWQFVLACLLDFISCMIVLMSGSGWGRSPYFYEWCIAAASFLLTIAILAEVCLFANRSLTSNVFWGIEVLKMGYVAMLFGGWGWYMNYPFTEKEVLDHLLNMGINLTPWVATTGYAIVVRYMQWPQDGDAGEEGTTRRPVDEETALLVSAPVMTEGIPHRDARSEETEKHLYDPSSGSSG